MIFYFPPPKIREAYVSSGALSDPNEQSLHVYS